MFKKITASFAVAASLLAASSAFADSSGQASSNPRVIRRVDNLPAKIVKIARTRPFTPRGVSPKEIVEGITDAQICFVPDRKTAGNGGVFYISKKYRKDPRPFQNIIELTMRLEEAAEGHSARSLYLQPVCQVKELDKGNAGEYSRLTKLEYLIASKDAVDESDTAFHENTHAEFDRKSIKIPIHTGGDYIVRKLFDEGNAYNRAGQLWFVNGLAGSGDQEKKFIQYLNHYYKNAKTLFAMTKLYGNAAEVKGYIEEHRHLPPAINRLMLVTIMDCLAEAQYIRRISQGILNKKITADDEALSKMLSYKHKNFYGEMPGMIRHVLPQLPVFWAKSQQEFDLTLQISKDPGMSLGKLNGSLSKSHIPEISEGEFKKLHAASQALETRPSALIGGIVDYLDMLSSRAGKAAPQSTDPKPLIKKFAGNPVLEAEFIQQDFGALFDWAVKGIGQNSSYGPRLKRELIEKVAQLRGGLLPGQPVHVVRARPSPGLQLTVQ